MHTQKRRYRSFYSVPSIRYYNRIYWEAEGILFVIVGGGDGDGGVGNMGMMLWNKNKQNQQHKKKSTSSTAAAATTTNDGRRRRRSSFSSFTTASTIGKLNELDEIFHWGFSHTVGISFHFSFSAARKTQATTIDLMVQRTCERKLSNFFWFFFFFRFIILILLHSSVCTQIEHEIAMITFTRPLIIIYAI